MDLRLHRRRWLRRVCRFCRDPWPCDGHRNAVQATGTRPRAVLLAASASGVLSGLALVAFAAWLVLR